VLGLSTLAIMVAMSDTNGGMFLALTSVMGDKEDAGTYVVQSIETGPFLTMAIFVGAGLAKIPYMDMVSVVAPISRVPFWATSMKTCASFSASTSRSSSRSWPLRWVSASI
jgi:hypothetical protein